MEKTTIHGSATIYQFPIGGRSALVGHRFDEAKPAADLGRARVSDAVIGGSWYHEEAIQKAKSGLEH